MGTQHDRSEGESASGRLPQDPNPRHKARDTAQRWLVTALLIYLAAVALNVAAWLLEASGFNPRN
jgi:hypothetical protein